MITAQQENARTLASAIGVDEEEASERLNRLVVVTVAPDDSNRHWAGEINALLERTLHTTFEPAEDACLELVVGPVAPRTRLRLLFASIDATKAVVSLQPSSVSTAVPHHLLAAVAASSVAAAAVALAVDAPELPSVDLPLTIPFDQLGLSEKALTRTLDLDGAVLIGAGAVGHAFLRALRNVDVRGSLPIVDPKTVGGGNPNRCLYLEERDIGANKAEALARNAQSDLPTVQLDPHVEDFHSYVAREGVQRTAIVTVDSRRVRRSIQGEIPGEVFDASTTDIRAVVVHHHRQPTDHACLSCIYRHVPDENAREQAIADGLGIEIAMVKESLISPEAATRISRLHPQIAASTIEGMAYDSLFKQLCAEQALRTPEGRQVLAPFAFVSSLAGALLVIEMLKSDSGAPSSNYWQVNPWGAPNARLRRLRERVVDCEFCSRPEFLSVADQLWGAQPSP